MPAKFLLTPSGNEEHRGEAGLNFCYTVFSVFLLVSIISTLYYAINSCYTIPHSVFLSVSIISTFMPPKSRPCLVSTDHPLVFDRLSSFELIFISIMALCISFAIL